MKKTLSIGVCTYNRGFILEESLQSIRGQTIPFPDIDVFVVDNNSTDNTREIVSRLQETWPALRYILEEKQGIANTRTRALVEAQAEWLAFMDDDAKAHPDWVATIQETIAKGDFDAFGGPYYAWHFFGPAPAWFPEKFGRYDGQANYGKLEEEGYLAGSNSAFKVSIALQVGGFPAELGMKGKKCAYGEETLLFNRMKDAGAVLGFVPEMKIDHCVLPYKYTVSWQLHSRYAYGISYAKITNIHTVKDVTRVIRQMVRLVLRAPISFFRVWRATGQWQKALLQTMGPVCWHWGCCVAGIKHFFTESASKKQ